MRREMAHILIDVLETFRLAWAGAPQVIRLDMAGNRKSQEFRVLGDSHNVKLNFAPREAHSTLCIWNDIMQCGENSRNMSQNVATGLFKGEFTFRAGIAP